TYTMYRDQSHSFEQVAALRPWNANLTGQGEAERIQGLRVTSNFFLTLGVQPALGRVFSPEEDKPGTNSVVVLSESFWRTHFGSDRTLVGKSILLNGSNFTVIGIMPPRFEFPREVQLWTPMAFTPGEQSSFVENLSGVARLRDGVSIQQAQAEMGTF